MSSGPDLHFAPGEYAPKTPEGASVLAHEISHSLQQMRGGSPAGRDTLEREAGSAASDVTSGFKVSAPFSAASPSVPLFLRRGESPVMRRAGPRTADVADIVRKRLKRDERDSDGEARERLDALRPDVRRETAELIKDEATPEQRMKLSLDSQEKRSAAPAREVPEPERPKAAPEPAAKPAQALEAPGEKEAEEGRAPAAATTAPAPTKPGEAEAAKPVAGEAVPTAEAGQGAQAPAVEGAAAAEPAPVPGPESNPEFQALTGGVKSRARVLAKHKSASVARADAQSAAVSPPNERESGAQANQANTMAGQETKDFDRSEFKKALLEKVEAITPKNLEQAAEFKSSGKAGEIKAHVSGEVQASKEKAAGGLPAATTAEPNLEAVPERQSTTLTPEAAGPGPSTPATGAAAPPPRTDEEVSLDAGPKQIDGEMEQAGVTEEQLQKSGEPTFHQALEAREEVRADAATSPAQFRADEQATLDATKQDAAVEVAGGLQGMYGSRGRKLGQAAEKQDKTKSKDETERARVAGDINSLFAATKKAVEDRLARLEKESGEAFDKGAENARDNLETYCDTRMRAYKSERYSGLLGKGRWLKDKLFDLPDEVNVFYVEGKARYIQEMDGVIDNVATIVETGLTEAKALVQEGKKKIGEYVDLLPANLKQFGEEAEKGLESEFDALEQSIADKKDALVDTLAQRYVDSMNKVEERIAAMKEANKGLVSKAVGAVKGVIKAIVAIKNLFLNVLSRVAQCIGDILSDPIGFVGNFFSAIGKGLMQFVKNIGKHLLNGLMGWLFGALAEAGIQLPERFDLKGILGLVLQVLGLTYQNIRMRAVKLLGEKVVGALETTSEVFMTLVKEGPAGLWNWIKDQFTALKDMVMEGIQALVAEKIVQAGITWLLGMLNPVGAFIKICLLLKDVVIFLIERGKQLVDFVLSVIDSIAAVASGKLDQAANWIEGSLAKAVPLVISFLASLIGLGGISSKIRGIIERIQKPINGIIDGVIKGAVKALKSVGKAFGFGKKEEKKTAKEDATGIGAVAIAAAKDRAKGITSITQVQSVVSQVEEEYKPQGLKELSLTLAENDHDIGLTAKVNPTSHGSFGMFPSREETMWTKVIHKKPAAAPVTRPEVTSQRITAKDVGLKKTIPLDVGDQMHETKTDVSTFVFANAFAGCAGHAEVSFSTWYKTQPQYREHVDQMHITLGRSPCRSCTKVLLNMKDDLEKDRKLATPLKITLDYSFLYGEGKFEGPFAPRKTRCNHTEPSDIDDLTTAGFKVTKQGGTVKHDGLIQPP